MPSRETDNSSKIASKWFVQLNSGNARESDYQAWQAWRAAAPENESAWQHIEQITEQFRSYSAKTGVSGTLRRLYEQTHSAGRRRILKQFAVVIAVGSTSYISYKQAPWQNLVADYSTATGEYREIMLADGTRMFLNTSSSVDIAFDETHRVLKLIKGEVLIETGHEAGKAYRPFILKTQHGQVTALGTRFIVRDHERYSSVSVFEGAVMVAPKNSQNNSIKLHSGESIHFTPADIINKGIADSASASWTQGFIVVDQLSLSELIAELSRYRRGLLQCDPSLSRLMVSGSFPTDTDAALEILSRKFPIQIHTFTRYWTKVIPA